MKPEDKVINYRPELAEQLSQDLEFAVKFYSMDFRQTYYRLLASTYREKNEEVYRFLSEACECLDNKNFGEEIFYEKYQPILVGKFGLKSVSKSDAACEICQIYESVFTEKQHGAMLPDLTKSETYMVKQFYDVLSGPVLRMQKLDIQIKNIQLQIEYIQKLCQTTIDIFNTPDDEEQIPQ